MRISDWSSDVCSSGLRTRTMRIGLVVDSACDLPKDFIERHDIEILPIAVRIDGTTEVDYRDQAATLAFLDSHIAEDRKSVVKGKSVSVRVDLGGSRTNKKKKKQNIVP